jgi:HAD superfamily hydrolase (TIGR01549 family)
MRPKALLFDFGGTLDTNGLHWSPMLRRGFCIFGVTLTDEEFARAYIEAEKECVSGRIHHSDGLFTTLLHQSRALAMHLSKNRPADQGQQLSDHAMQVALWSMREVSETISRIMPLLVSLHDAYRLGVVSNFYGNLATVCDELGILPYFDCLIDSECVECRKPDIKIFSIALEALGEEPRDVVMIGDSYANDIVPSKHIGCRTIWLEGISWEKIEVHSCADHIVHSLLEVPPVLETMK